MKLKYIIAPAVAGMALILLAGVALAAEVTYDFTVAGMECARDEVAVNQKVNSTAGVLNCTADLQNTSALVKFDDQKVTPEAIKKAIEAEGYKVTGFGPAR